MNAAPAAPDGTALTDAALRRQILRFAVPASLEMVVQQLFLLIDQLFVARLGEASFVAAGLTVQVLALPFTLFVALATAASIRLSRLVGSQAEVGFSTGAAQALQATAVLALAVTSVNYLAAPMIFAGLGVTPEVAERATLFTRLVGWSLPLMAMTEVGNQLLRTRGQARAPLLVGAVALASNSLLNYALIFGNLGLPKLGLAGAGLATVIARGLGLALVLWLLAARSSHLQVRWRDLRRPQLAGSGTLLRLAAPMALGQALWLLGMLAYTRVFAELGTSELAAAGMIGQLEGLCVLASYGFGAACLVLIGQQLGRGDRATALRVAAESWRLARWAGTSTAFALAAVALLVDQLYPAIEPSTRALAVLGLWLSAALQLVKVSNMVLAVGVLRGGGDVRFVTLCDGLLALGLSTAWVLGVELHWGLAGVIAGKACEELTKLAVFFWRYRSGRWIHELR